jgi:hypothetical protein
MDNSDYVFLITLKNQYEVGWHTLYVHNDIAWIKGSQMKSLHSFIAK